ncbi:LysR family transcriptional regulator [Microlunatus speluncae]|uniref:LysR family transcriptional regulator n=1 Tax=Microlunatus speluncae TaxID=2594267 RepID=UPI0012663D29|nr:LysR family transcriptional regulator [Microlunatus speluncae]
MDLAAGLRAFVAVADQRSFTRGAELCAVPQPVISRRLAGLERQLGVSLLARTSRSVELTDVGSRMLPYAREVVTRLERIESLAREETAELVIALPAGVDPRTLAAVRRGLAGRPTRFLELPAVERDRALRAGEADLALLPQAPDHAELSIRLGVGTADPAGREFRLDRLRRTGRQRDRSGPTLHLDDEDDTPAVRDPLLRAAYAHGLRADQVAVGLPRTEVLTRVYELGDCLVCPRPEAERHGLSWQPIAGLPLLRGYLARSRPGRIEPDALELIMDRLRRGLGADG